MKREVWLLLLVLSIPIVLSQQAPSGIITNSKNWQDVYSSVLFSKLYGVDEHFLVSERHALIYLQTLDKDKPNQILLESDVPYYSGFERSLEDEGFQVERIRESNNNLALARKLLKDRDIRSFIILDDAYGYNAISVAPYATLTKSYVIFANRFNIDDVADFLADAQPEKILTVGRVHREVRDALVAYNPEQLSGEGRFEINVEITRRFMQILPMNQVIITNGEFIEDQLFIGVEPIVFIGKENIPDITRQYLQSSGVRVAVLIGNDLVQTGALVKRELGITTFVKFARTARIPSGTMSQVEGLDLFYLPQYSMSMDVASAQYNELMKTLEVTFQNTAQIAVYFRPSLTVDDGITNSTLGADEPVFMDAGESRTIAYPYDTQSDAIRIKTLVVYGESPTSLEKAIEKTLQAEFVRILDSSELNLLAVKYLKTEKAFAIRVTNPGQVDTYANLEIKDVFIDGTKTTLGSKKVVPVPAGKEMDLYVRAQLTDLDLADNPFVHVIAHYGQRQEALIKTAQERLDLEVESVPLIALIAAAIVIIAILVFFFRKKKRHTHKV